MCLSFTLSTAAPPGGGSGPITDPGRRGWPGHSNSAAVSDPHSRSPGGTRPFATAATPVQPQCHGVSDSERPYQSGPYYWPAPLSSSLIMVHCGNDRRKIRLAGGVGPGSNIQVGFKPSSLKNFGFQHWISSVDQQQESGPSLA